MAEDIKLIEGSLLDTFKDFKMLGITALGLKHINNNSQPVSDNDLPGFLISNPATVIFQIDQNRTFSVKNETIYEKKLSAGNLQEHSDGGFVILQDVGRNIGPWVLDEEQKTLYLQNTTSPHLSKPQFMDHAPNPLKIDRVYYGIFHPESIINSFKKRGYVFVNKPMSQDRWDIVMPRGYVRHR